MNTFSRVFLNSAVLLKSAIFKGKSISSLLYNTPIYIKDITKNFQSRFPIRNYLEEIWDEKVFRIDSFRKRIPWAPTHPSQSKNRKGEGVSLPS